MEKKQSTKKADDQKQFTAFRMLLLGRSGVGKTYSGLKYSLELIKEGLFDPRRVVLISATWKSDSSQEELIKYCSSKYKEFAENNCCENIDLDFLEKLFETQKMIKETDSSKLKNWLLIFDDQISSLLIKKSDRNPQLKNLFCIGRHYNISQIWMLQRFKSTIDATCRDQFTNVAIFKQGNKKALIELLQDYDESSSMNYKDSVKNLYDWYLESVESNQGHGCLVINVLNSWGQNRIQKNLSNDKQFDM